MARRSSLASRGAAAAVACGLLACAQGAPAQAPASERAPDAAAAQAAGPAGRPLLWRAEGPPGGGSFYLLGSVHLGKREVFELGAVINEAYAASDELVVEVDLASVSQEEIDALVERFAYLPNSQTLDDVVSDATLASFWAYVEERGMAAEDLYRMKPWFLSVMIVQHELAKAGYELDLGVDRLFIDEAEGSKPIVGLETIDGQLTTFDSVPEDVQELMLKDTLTRAARLPRETEELMEAWQRGDEQMLHRLVFAPLESAPELESFYEHIFFARDRAMTSRLVELGEDGKTRFVVLGAGHMVGDRGIPALLARRGYRVARVGG